MSLTSMLEDAGSPLRRFLAAELPGVAAVRADCRARLPAEPDIVRPAPPAGVRPAWGTLGAAIDHRLRLALSDRPPFRGAVRAGVELVAQAPGVRSPGAGLALRAAGLDLIRESAALVPLASSAAAARTEAVEERLARMCVVTAWFEEVYRTRRAFPGTALGMAGEAATLDDLLVAVPAYAVADVVAMLGRAAGVLRELERPVTVGPVFAGSSDVGGADADWIAGGLLVDVKATTTASKLPGADVHQLISYVLLDYGDQHGIDRVGWYFARTGALVAWEVGSFLALLGSTHPIGELRARLAAVLGAAAHERRPAPPGS